MGEEGREREEEYHDLQMVRKWRMSIGFEFKQLAMADSNS